ncbi:MAG: pantetheine-phosphate adenylyltransferase [Deltaproteobacteria bacterium]|nr:pantetheine-phosphate adenylyltransferase [Deltaproteobacteria bacterium]
MKVAVYPGSFDPVTLGHVDIIERSLKLFDQVVVLIATSSQKKELFSVAEKKDMLREVFKNEQRVLMDATEGLLVDYARTQKVAAIVRGLRAVSDFEYEFQMASMNKRLYPEVETIFMMASDQNHFISSQLVREVARLGGNLKGIVHPYIEKKLKEKFKL